MYNVHCTRRVKIHEIVSKRQKTIRNLTFFFCFFYFVKPILRSDVVSIKKTMSSTNKRNSNVFGSISQALERDLFSTT